MSQILAASIDLTKIDKSRIVQGKNGAQYYNITIIVNDTKDQYGNDISVQQGQTKDERAAKASKVFIGNGKIIYDSGSKASTPQPTSTEADNGIDKLPF